MLTRLTAIGNTGDASAMRVKAEAILNKLVNENGKALEARKRTQAATTNVVSLGSLSESVGFGSSSSSSSINGRNVAALSRSTAAAVDPNSEKIIGVINKIIGLIQRAKQNWNAFVN